MPTHWKHTAVPTHYQHTASTLPANCQHNATDSTAGTALPLLGRRISPPCRKNLILARELYRPVLAQWGVKESCRGGWGRRGSRKGEGVWGAGRGVWRLRGGGMKGKRKLFKSHGKLCWSHCDMGALHQRHLCLQCVYTGVLCNCSGN